MCDLLTDDYLEYLRGLDRQCEAYLMRLDALPLAATANPELSPDGEAVAVGGSTTKQQGVRL